MRPVVVAQVEVHHPAVLVGRLQVGLRADRVVAVGGAQVVHLDHDAAPRVGHGVAALRVRLDREAVACPARGAFALAGAYAEEILRHGCCVAGLSNDDDFVSVGGCGILYVSFILTYIGVEPAGHCVTVAVWRVLWIVGSVPRDGHVIRRRVAVLRSGEDRELQRDEERREDHVVLPNLKPCLALSDEKKGRGTGSDRIRAPAVEQTSALLL